MIRIHMYALLYLVPERGRVSFTLNRSSYPSMSSTQHTHPYRFYFLEGGLWIAFLEQTCNETGQQSSCQSVKAVCYGISIGLWIDGLPPVPGRKTPHQLRGNPYIFSQPGCREVFGRPCPITTPCHFISVDPNSKIRKNNYIRVSRNMARRFLKNRGSSLRVPGFCRLGCMSSCQGIYLDAERWKIRLIASLRSRA